MYSDACFSPRAHRQLDFPHALSLTESVPLINPCPLDRSCSKRERILRSAAGRLERDGFDGSGKGFTSLRPYYYLRISRKSNTLANANLLIFLSRSGFDRP
jgi:hypothetical protein